MQTRRIKGLTPGPYDVAIQRDLRVPMDDGVELLADLITPVGPVGDALPTIVIRGPYGRRGPVAGWARALAREGFPVLFQSCRGTWGSGGVFTPQVDEQRDGIATHRWVRQQPWFTGKVATFGPSYMGFTQWAVAGKLQREDPVNAPDALCLVVTMPDFGPITWDNGTFALRNALGWTQMMDRMIRRDMLPLALAMIRPDPKLGRAFGVLPLRDGDTVATGHQVDWYQDWVAHDQLTDDYWTQQSHTASVPDVTAPIYMITGWYDIFLPAQLRNHAQLTAAGRPPRLTVGPWGHVSKGMDAPAIGETTAFLKEHFAGAPATRVAPVRAYRTGAEVWHDLQTWPPSGVTAQSLFLSGSGRLDAAQPSDETTTYVYDPEHPTPSVGGPSLLPDSGPVDNAEHEKRADVVVFRGDPLTAPATIAGEPVAHIRFRSSQPSADVFVRICDVHPDGRSMTVCDGIQRVETSPDFQDVEVALWPTFHEFAPGHRISVQISSGAHPRYARNPGSPDTATTHRATQEIAHDGSRIDLPVLP
ncbi:CocE/NonD family hydrolase [Winogradskya consettensis]|uniref:X-Pro dipeptidyl-peptidase n=2 Tax=Winogradskya consettensis TaxID=113560 RepID=A0A919SXN5_9ACTN|nr:X-Pro dipeptidyl-peptidase [Actinoplanes consettensis]